METIKVNMSPNPLDVQTIHASQNDTEARQWEFELHNNGELIDTSDVKEQLVFKAYKGGTEQLLPENGSTPTTSPFLGDIRYPQGLLTDQEFTYRQSPTEEDGNAKITDIKGNTLVWNQLINDTGSTTTTNGITFTKNADGSITLNGTATAQADYTFARFDYINGHKYLINGIPSGATVDGYRAFLFQRNVTANRILTPSIDDWFTPRIRVSEGVTVSNVVFRLNIFDLTLMFGAGNEPTDINEFTSLFPLSYYSYNQGSLLSFNGNGIKTVGKNILNSVRTVGTTYTINGVSIVLQNDGSFILNGTCIGSNVLNLVSLVASNRGVPFNKGSYILSGSLDGTSSTNVEMQYYIPSIGSSRKSASPISFTLNEQTEVAIRIFVNDGKTYNNDVVYPMLRFADVEDSSFEPYTTQTTNLPVSTYFPTGMKSAGTVYDELTETKAITRVGQFQLGTINYNYSSTSGQERFTSINLPFSIPSTDGLVCSKYETIEISGWSELANKDKVIARSPTQPNVIAIRDTSHTSAVDFKQMLINENVILYYELATPTETSFTTASLVTENAEIPLSNEDGVLLGKCTEQLSENPGFIDAKIKLADDDGECYSNKIQLHVERSPQ